MIYLNCGNKWTLDFLDKVIKLNDKYIDNNIRVNELYGNPQDPILSSVRADARVPSATDKIIKEFVKTARKANIDINFTLNKSCIGEVTSFNLNTMQKRIDYYKDLGVTRFTLFSPYLISKLDFPNIEISTIHNNTNINYLHGVCKLSPKIDKICLPIYMNRDFKKLKACSKLLPKPELVVNEFCASYKGICIYRTECYNLQSHNQNLEYPFKNCSEYRKKTNLSWLKSPFILPQWLLYYSVTANINYFKLTGRTHSQGSLLNIIETYLKMDYKGPIHKLWGEGLPYQDLVATDNILAEDLVDVGFINGMNIKEFECETALCDTECSYCAKKLMEIKNGKKRQENPLRQGD
jgi:hypothetical protein